MGGGVEAFYTSHTFKLRIYHLRAHKEAIIYPLTEFLKGSRVSGR